MKDMEEIQDLARQRFIHDMIDGRLSVQESLEQGKALGIDITAEFYSIVLLQFFPKDADRVDISEYSGTNEEIYKLIRECFDDLENVFLYEQVGDVLCFLEKADSLDEMSSNIQRGIDNIRDIMMSYEDYIYFIAAGKPVERIRDVNSSYRDASRKFAERYMLDESTIFVGEGSSLLKTKREDS